MNQEEEDTGVLNPTLSGDIHLDNVSLIYPDSTIALRDFNLEIRSGETVALVGRSGAGKSSLVNLLTRTLTTTSGQIRIDGLPIEEITLESLRSQIAMVDQQVVLFNTTILNNIAYGSLANKSYAEVERAAKDAFAHDFIMKMPNGYQSEIGAEGLQLSAASVSAYRLLGHY